MLAATILSNSTSHTQTVILLYDDKIPNSKPYPAEET